MTRFPRRRSRPKRLDEDASSTPRLSSWLIIRSPVFEALSRLHATNEPCILHGFKTLQQSTLSEHREDFRAAAQATFPRCPSQDSLRTKCNVSLTGCYYILHVLLVRVPVPTGQVDNKSISRYPQSMTPWHEEIMNRTRLDARRESLPVPFPYL